MQNLFPPTAILYGQAYPKSIAGLIPDHCNKVYIAINGVTHFLLLFPSAYESYIYAIVVQSLSRVWLFATPWTVAHQVSLSHIISQSLPEFMTIESVMLSNHFILCHLLLFLPSIFPIIRVFSSELALRIR